MPSVTARRLCPDLVFVRHNFDRYHEVSETVFGIFREFTDFVEPLSIDEAFLDVTDDKKGIGSATIIAKEIRKRIREVTGLTASAGVSVNKFLAKIASDVRKPDGLFVIGPDEAEKYIESLPVEKFFGIGKVTARQMHKLGIHFGSDLKKWDRESLVRNFGKSGLFFYEIARGIDERPVETSYERKSIGTELTYEKDLTSRFEIIAELYKVEKELMARLEAAGTTGRTITVKVKFADFRQITRSHTLRDYIRSFDTLHREVTVLRKGMMLEGERIRLLGVSISGLEGEREDDPQLELPLTAD
jgi:DNA polymerase-4